MLSGENARVLGAVACTPIAIGTSSASQQQDSAERENAQNCEEEPTLMLPDDPGQI